MIKKVVILPDVHITQYVPKSYELVKKFIKDFKPDETIILGDFVDVSSLSHWDLNKRKTMEGKRYKKETDLVNQELDYLQKHSKKVTYLFGNHELFCDRYIETSPELDGIINLPIILKLKERNIKWYKYNDIYTLGKCNFVHGLFTNQNHTKKTLDAIDDNIVYGHVHQAQSYFRSAKNKHPIMAYSLGCLCNKAPEYMEGKWANWITGFAVMYYDEKGFFNLYPINIIKNRFIFNGKLYK